MSTPVIHARTEPLREFAKQLDAAAVFAKPVYIRELVDQLLTAIATECHRVDKLEARVAALERFPETPRA
jgi:hypothetical protein